MSGRHASDCGGDDIIVAKGDGRRGSLGTWLTMFPALDWPLLPTEAITLFASAPIAPTPTAPSTPPPITGVDANSSLAIVCECVCEGVCVCVCVCVCV